MHEEFYTKGSIDRKKRFYLYSNYNYLFEKMTWFSIPNFSVKFVSFIYAIGEKGFSKRLYSSRDGIDFGF